ncbi:MAG: DNA replication/repair protein RecF [Clostridia bacterium]|nr:DNA replication/repair protein RecF [Clostridia bacterium]
MFIKNIELTNFRNYEHQKIFFSHETNIIFGNNAQGKTNILEAISLFSSGKSYRRVSDKNLIKYDCDFARIRIEFDSFNTEKSAEIIFTKGKNKFIKLNGISLSRTSELLGVFNCVVFSPEELYLINGAPELRRNFIDLFISSQKPLYYNTLKRYYKVLKQKNNLLKDINNNFETLNIWNEELAENGAKIIVYRKEYLAELSKRANEAYKKISGGREELKILYNQNVSSENYEKSDLKNRILEAIERKKQKEIAIGASLVGIHRDDIDFFIDGQDARIFASQGQQRSAIISLKMAQAEIIKNQSGEYPVFLFDDVMSELDSERREFIASEIKNSQVIITSTDRYSSGKKEKFFYVENGTVREVT